MFRAHVLETCRGMKQNLLLNKFCASSWLNTEITIGKVRSSVCVSKTQGRTLGVEVKFRTDLREYPFRTSGAVIGLFD